MGLESCAECGRVYSGKNGDICYSDGGVMEAIHGGGWCKEHYLKRTGNSFCGCGAIVAKEFKYCGVCGKKK